MNARRARTRRGGAPRGGERLLEARARGEDVRAGRAPGAGGGAPRVAQLAERVRAEERETEEPARREDAARPRGPRRRRAGRRRGAPAPPRAAGARRAAAPPRGGGATPRSRTRPCTDARAS